jgi:hypothetical protein
MEICKKSNMKIHPSFKVIFSCNWFISSSRCGTRLFLAFATIYLLARAHNMLAIILLGPQFKSIKVLHEFVGNDVVTKGNMKKYDQNIILPLLLQVYSHVSLVNAPIEHVANLDYFFCQPSVWDCVVSKWDIENLQH